MTRITRRSLFRGSAAAAAGSLLAGRASAIEPIARTGGSRVKLSCCAYSYRQYLTGRNPTMTLNDFVDLCVGMGLDGVELTSYYFPKPPAPEFLAALKRRVFLAGLAVSGTSVGNNFCVPAGAGRQKQCADVKAWVDHSAALGAPAMRVFAGSAPKGTPEEEARKWVIECLEECCDYASTRGVILAVENHGGVTATPEGLLEIVRGVKSDWCGVNLDTGNFRTEDPYAAMVMLAPYAVTTHFKTHVSPKGKPSAEVDLDAVLEALHQANYRGYLSLEYEDKEDPKTGVPKAIEKAQRALRG